MLALLRFPIEIWTGTLVSVALVSGLPLLVTLIMARQEAHLRRWLPQLTAFGAGTVLAAAVGHLIPESLRLGQSPLQVAGGVVAGFVVFALIERALAGHDHAHAHGVPLGAPSAHDSDSSEAECVHLHPTPPLSIIGGFGQSTGTDGVLWRRGTQLCRRRPHCRRFSRRSDGRSPDAGRRRLARTPP